MTRWERLDPALASYGELMVAMAPLLDDAVRARGEEPVQALMSSFVKVDHVLKATGRRGDFKTMIKAGKWLDSHMPGITQIMHEQLVRHFLHGARADSFAVDLDEVIKTHAQRCAAKGLLPF